MGKPTPRTARPTKPASDAGANLPEESLSLRIVGGKFRGRRLKYSGDPRTRPMKDRVREAVFNLLGPDVSGCHAIDLFAGTGALGLEALSRGAAQATLIERHYPTAKVLRENVELLGCQDIAMVVPSDTFFWARQAPPGMCRWLVFCSPPYDLYVDPPGAMVQLIATLWQAAPAASLFVVEADERFDFGTLPSPAAWSQRVYPPAHVAIARTPASASATTPAAATD